MSVNTDSLTEPAEKIAADSHAEAVESLARNHTVWDRLGIVGSALCIIHCLALPFLIGALSLGALGFLADEIFHQILAVLLLGVALFAFIPGFRHHGNKLVVIGGMAGISLLLATGFLLDHFISHGLEIGLTVVASLVLLSAHFANWRLCADRKESCCDH